MGENKLKIVWIYNSNYMNKKISNIHHVNSYMLNVKLIDRES